MDFFSILRATAALGIVLAMIWGAMWLLRRYGGQFMQDPNGKADRQLKILETLTVQPRHRLVRLQNGDNEHLILMGPDGNLELSAPSPLQHATRNPSESDT